MKEIVFKGTDVDHSNSCHCDMLEQDLMKHYNFLSVTTLMFVLFFLFKFILNIFRIPFLTLYFVTDFFFQSYDLCAEKKMVVKVC